MNIQSTIYIDKWLYNWLCRYQMTIQLTMYTGNDYTIAYTSSQMTIQSTIYIDKWLYNWLYT